MNFARLAIAATFWGMGGVAFASVACEVVADAENPAGVPMFSEPDLTSDIVRTVPIGDLVGYPDADLAPQTAEGWTWVQHDETQRNVWQDGEYGWMWTKNLDLCG